MLSPVTVFLKSPELGNVPNLDFEKEQVGLETVKDLGSKIVLDAFTCVECGRCQVNCPAWGAGKELNPKALILQTQEALLAGERDRKLGEIYSEKVLWQCTTCGACENQCPVGIEHLPLIIGARRGLVSNGDAPDYMGGVYNNLERRGNIWGLGYDQRQKFVESTALEIFDPAKHDVLVWLGCAGAFEADFQKSLRSLFEILRARHVKFGVLSKERCTGDPAKRTGNEYMFQELANGNIADLKAAGPKKILTSCPHCVKTIGDDYRQLRVRRGDRPLRRCSSRSSPAMFARGLATESVTFHDPCYLGRYAGKVDEPRDLLERFGGDISEPERNRENPYCCGAGGGLLFADKEEEPGSRISDVRFKQLPATGAGTVVTACPFCSIMLKGAQTSAPGARVAADDAVRGPHDVRERPRCDRSDAAAWQASRRKRLRGRRHLRPPATASIAALGATLTWRTEGLEHLDAIAAQRPPADHGVLARTHPSGHLLSSAAAASSSSPARISTASGSPASSSGLATARRADRRRAADVKALLQLTRDMAAGKAGRLHRGRPARPGAASRRRARCGWRRPPAIRSCRFISRPVGTGRRAAGTARRFRSRSRPCRSRWGSPSTFLPMPVRPSWKRLAGSSKTGSTRSNLALPRCYIDMPVILVASPRFAAHQTPPGHPESSARAGVMDQVADAWRTIVRNRADQKSESQLRPKRARTHRFSGYGKIRPKSYCRGDAGNVTNSGAVDRIT